MTPQASAEALLGHAVRMLDETRILTGDPKAAANAIAQVRECLKLLAQLQGELQAGPTLQVVLQHPGVQAFVDAVGRATLQVLTTRYGEAAALEALGDIMAAVEEEQRAALASGGGAAGGRRR